jgi:hypothetical protein
VDRVRGGGRGSEPIEYTIDSHREASDRLVKSGGQGLGKSCERESKRRPKM